jgi:AraC family transcriptional regulator
MSVGRPELLPLISDICGEVDEDLSLGALARRSGRSQSHFHRSFTGFADESPKQYTQRVRLERAAAELLATDASVMDVALGAGFASHEVFTRAFKRHFGQPPRDFRAASSLGPDERLRYREVVQTVSPCIRLYRISLTRREETQSMPTSDIERRELQSEQPMLYIRRRIPLNRLQQTMGECFGALYGYGQKAGLPIAGQPIARYASTGAGLWTVDFIMPLSAPADANGEMEPGVLASGPVAFAVHHGPYDRLSDTYAAIETWAERNGYGAGGPPWESYVTDPGQTPDPADWRTEVFWPLKA